MLPARRCSATVLVIQLECFELAASEEQLLSTTMQHDVLCKMLRKHRLLSYKAISEQLVQCRHQSSIVDYFAK